MIWIRLSLLNRQKTVKHEVAKVEAAGYNPVAVSDRSADILDSALTGLPDEDITDLYAVLTVVSDYKTVKAVYESDESLHQFELTPDQYPVSVPDRL